MLIFFTLIKMNTMSVLINLCWCNDTHECRSTNKQIKVREKKNAQQACIKKYKNHLIDYIQSLQPDLNVRENITTKLPSFTIDEEENKMNLKSTYVQKKTKAYIIKASYVHIISSKMVCVAHCNYIKQGEIYIKKNYLEVSQNIINKYKIEDPINYSYFTVKSVFKNCYFDDFIKKINKYIDFKSSKEFIDTESIKLFSNKVIIADIVCTDWNAALNALKFLNSKNLTKEAAIKNLVNLIVFASRQDVKFYKVIVNSLIDDLNLKKLYNQVEGEIDEKNPICIICLASHACFSDIKDFSGFLTTLNIKVGIILYSIYNSIKYNQLTFSY